jgi:hypothetical protein
LFVDAKKPRRRPAKALRALLARSLGCAAGRDGRCSKGAADAADPEAADAKKESGGSGEVPAAAAGVSLETAREQRGATGGLLALATGFFELGLWFGLGLGGFGCARSSSAKVVTRTDQEPASAIAKSSGAEGSSSSARVTTGGRSRADGWRSGSRSCGGARDSAAGSRAASASGGKRRSASATVNGASSELCAAAAAAKEGTQAEAEVSVFGSGTRRTAQKSSKAPGGGKQKCSCKMACFTPHIPQNMKRLEA